jgi:glycosyltransferase involved in cell wall biosynthesis
MRFLFIEPYYGGSHKVFCEGLQKFSKHEITILKLSAENFKWKIRGASWYFKSKIKNIYEYDGIIMTDMINLSDFRALYKKKIPPVLFYFHENQLDYPLASNQKIDYHLCFSNINSALSSDLLYFNSNTHKKSFLKSVSTILSRMPKDDFEVSWINEELDKKADFIYPGCDFSYIENKNFKNKIPVILWNHRWDHDKNPEDFFKLLSFLKRDKIDFRLIILGEKGPKKNIVFYDAKKKFSREIIHFGYIEDKKQYFNLLKNSDLAITTSIQENFGYSVLEAIYAGCVPVLPDRLSYPEIISKKFYKNVLHKNFSSMYKKVKNYLLNPHLLNENWIKELRNHAEQFSWENMISEYDHILENLADLS